MSADKKEKLIEMIDRSHLPVKETCKVLKLERRRYYRWKRRRKDKGREGLKDSRPGPRKPLNKLLPSEVGAIIKASRKHQKLKHRKLVPKLSDESGVSVSASSVYRVLKRRGLIPKREVREGAGDEFSWKTERPNELWQIDICYIPIIGYDHWYLISVLDDYSRKIMNHELCWSMTTDDLLGVIDGAMLRYELFSNPPKILSDNGTQMRSNDFKEYVEDLKIEHIRTAYRHPETIGKIERYHRSVKEEDVFPEGYDNPYLAKEGIDEYIRWYNEVRPHKALDYVTPEEKYWGLDEEIIEKREKLKEETLKKRKRINRMKEEVLV